MENKTSQQPFTSIDPYFVSEDIQKEQKPQKNSNNKASLFDSEESKIAMIRIMLSVIGKEITDVDQNFIDNIFSKDNYIPKIFSEFAEKSCKHCYGRGFSGWDTNPNFEEHIPIICKCLKRKYMDRNKG